jgi:type IV pilus assembly protein PilV
MPLSIQYSTEAFISKMSNFRPHSARRELGVSLIEALVALLVLALGVMGMAGIQTRTLVESRTTNSRAVAIQMADDLSERMQANVAIRLSNPATNPYVVGWGTPATATDCFSNNCTGAQLAGFDLVQWKNSLSQLLPNGDARVFRSNTDPTQFGVLIGWSESQAKNEGAATGAEATQYTNAIAITTGVGGITCTAGLICHLVYIRP